jgi:hypothetical protein
MTWRIKETVFLSFWGFCLALSACTSPLPPSVDSTSTNTATTSKEHTPPPLLYIANNQLYELKVDGFTLMRAELGEHGNILDAIRVNDMVFVLRGKGLQKIEIETGIARMTVGFDKIPLFGEITRTSNDDVLLYSIALDSTCSSTGIGATIGFYQGNQDTFRDVFVKDEGYIKPLGLTDDEQSIYGLPTGCDPEFDRFWIISIDQGAISRELATSDATSKEYGEGYAALSPDAHYVAFLTLRYLEDVPKYRLSVYDLDHLTIKRYELPQPPSYTGELFWSPTSQTLYFILNPGTPYDDASKSYGLWSFDIHTGIFSPVTSLNHRFIHIVTISPDGQWVLLQPEMEQSVTYVYLPTGEQVLIKLPSEGVSKIVR